MRQGTSTHGPEVKHRLEFEPGLSNFQLSPQTGHSVIQTRSLVCKVGLYQVELSIRWFRQRVWSTQTLTRVRCHFSRMMLVAAPLLPAAVPFPAWATRPPSQPGDLFHPTSPWGVSVHPPGSSALPASLPLLMILSSLGCLHLELPSHTSPRLPGPLS